MSVLDREPSASASGMPLGGASRVALLTPRGRGAVATLLLQGDCRVLDHGERRMFQAANGRPVLEQPIGRIVFGKWRGEDESEAAEEVVLCRRTLDRVELHCHGGDIAAARILQDLTTVGCSVHSWQELMAATAGAFATEGQEALARTRTLRTAGILSQQVGGTFRERIDDLLSRDLENSGQREDALRQIDEWLNWSDFGLHLTRPWRVVLTGRPNVGKSSLINALLGFARSIVYDEPGTTRDVVTAETALAGWPVELADTAGLRERHDVGPAEDLEAAGIQKAKEHLESADCRLLVLDLTSPLTQDDHALLAAWPTAIVVGNKVDIVGCRTRLMPVPMIFASARTGAGLDQLIGEIVKRLVPRIPDPDCLLPFTERHVQLLTQAREVLKRGNVEAFQSVIRELLA